jgi:glycosyltransferase involved in cell wall biosynthesis
MNEPLHVALNCFFLEPRSGGTGTYTTELINSVLALEPETRFTVFATHDLPEEFRATDWNGRVDWEFVPGKVADGGLGSGIEAVATQWAVEAWKARSLDADVLHGLANIVPPISPVPTVVTILDLIWHHFPGAMTRRDSIATEFLARVSARRADRVVAISQAAKDDLVKTFKVDPAKIDVTLLGSREHERVVPTAEVELRARFGLGDAEVVLCVAQKRVHKNLAVLIDSVGLLGREDVVLVLPGAATVHEQELKALAERIGVADRVVFPEWVSDEDLEGLFAAASAFVLPSLMEGFGLPVLEAMQRGVPVACSNRSSLPEVAGDAALLFDPTDARDVAASIERLLGDRDLAADLVARGHERCLQMSWEHTARETLSSYRRAIAARRR